MAMMYISLYDVIISYVIYMMSYITICVDIVNDKSSQLRVLVYSIVSSEVLTVLV